MSLQQVDSLHDSSYRDYTDRYANQPSSTHRLSKLPSKMSQTVLEPRPLRVSPLIKFSRWSLLGLGILYGMYYQRKFSKIETARREKEALEKPMRDAKLAEEKKKALEAEMRYFEELSGAKK